MKFTIKRFTHRGGRPGPVAPHASLHEGAAAGRPDAAGKSGPGLSRGSRWRLRPPAGFMSATALVTLVSLAWGDGARAQAVTGKNLATGHAHTVVAREDGTVWGVGAAELGQLGVSLTGSSALPVQAGSLTDVVCVTAGAAHTAAVRSDGTLWMYGLNTFGQLGLGYVSVSVWSPTQVGALSGVTADVAAGDLYTLVLKTDGTVWGFGENGAGNLGDGTTTGRVSPVQATGLTDVVDLAAGSMHSLALKSDGTVWAFGANDVGQLGDGTNTMRLTAVQVSALTDVVAIAAAGSHSLALKSDGTVWTFGANGQGQLGDGTTTSRNAPVQVTGLTGVVAIAAGGGHSLALKADGTVWAFGANTYGQLGDGSLTASAVPVEMAITDVAAIAAGVEHSVLMKADGTLWGVGYSAGGRLGGASPSPRKLPMPVSGVTTVATLKAGGNSTGVVRSNGAVLGFGYNHAGQLGNGGVLPSSVPVQPTGLSGVRDLGLGHNHTVVAKTDGTVWSYGLNSLGQLGVTAGASQLTPVQVTALSDAKAVAVGYDHSLVLKTDGTVWGFGSNTNGKLGDGTFVSSRATPAQVSGTVDITAVAAGRGHSALLKSDGTVWTFGGNTDGQLGDGTTTSRYAPVQATGLTGAVAVAAGGQHTVVLKGDGTVWAFGGNASGQLGDGTTTTRLTAVQMSGLTNVVAIAVGEDHTVAVRGDGTVWAVGKNASGQLGDGTVTDRLTAVQVPGVTHAVAVAAGGGHTLALKIDGTLLSWGAGWQGQLREFGTGVPVSLPVNSPALGYEFVEPTAAIVSPPTETIVPLGTAQTLTAEVTGSAPAAKVHFYHQGVLLGTDDTAPYTVEFTPWTYGDFEITAVGEDELGALSLPSDPVVIRAPYDHDGDDLPDWWEHAHHGTLAHDQADDVDGDGLTEAGEYLYGSSPVDTDSDDDSITDGQAFATAQGLVATGVTVTERHANAVKLTWLSTCPFETSFRMEKSLDGGTTWVAAGSVPANATSCLVSGLPEKTAHLFRVATVSLYGTGRSAAVAASTKPAKPAAPAQLTLVSASPVEATLSWLDQAGNETGYVVEGKVVGAPAFLTGATTGGNATTATVGSLVGASDYVFRVRAVNTDGVDTEYSDYSSELTLPKVPSAPTSLVVAATLPYQASLGWALPVDATRTAVRVRGYDSTGANQRFQIDLAPAALQYVDTGLVPATTYQYKVAAVNERGETLTSFTGATTPGLLPATPTGVTATALAARAMLVNWTDNANNEVSYIVERSTTSGFAVVVASPLLPANTTSYEDRVGLKGATTYYYRVKAVNESGSSAYSATATGVTSNYPTANHAPDALGVVPDELALYSTSAPSYAVFTTIGTGQFTEAFQDGEFVATSVGTVFLWRTTPASPTGAAPLNQVEVYLYNGSSWVYQGALTPPGGAGTTSGFGTSIVASGNKAFIGAPGAVNGGSGATGLVYVLDFNGLSISSSVIAPPGGGAAGDQFGASLAVDGTRLIVGSPGKDKPNGGGSITDAGAAHLYNWNGSAWALHRTEYSLGAQTGGKYGFSVSLRGRNYVVGAPYEDGLFQVGSTLYALGDTGAVYLSRWNEPGQILGFQNLFALYPAVQAKIAGLGSSLFGYSVSIDSAMRIAVGRPASSWTAGDNMSAWDRGNVMLLQWNGELDQDYIFAIDTITDGALPAGARFGEYVEEAQGYELAVRTGLRNTTNLPGHYYSYLGFTARPGQVIGGVPVSRRVGDMAGLDEDADPLTFSIPGTSNPLATHFEIGTDGVLKAKNTLSGVTNGLYVLALAVSDDRGGSVARGLVVDVTGATASNDADQDGIDDTWELAHGLNPADGLDSLSDLDGDGYTALEEYQRALSGQSHGINPGSWDLDPNGDIDGDSIANKLDGNPHDPSVGQMNVQITAPGSGVTL